MGFLVIIKMIFDIITIFPNIFDSYLNESVLKRAQKNKLIQIKIHNLRDFTVDKNNKVALRQARGNRESRRTIDDKPYGGGAGMLLITEPILRATEKILKTAALKNRKTKIIIFSAKGKRFNQKIAYDWAKKFNHLILISGRYEGIDERVKKILKAEEVSIGPYVLTDGDVAGMTIISAVARLLPGVINLESLKEESYFNALLKKEKNSKFDESLEYPHYTRPEVLIWKGKKYPVPKVLLSGNHKKIEEWRRGKRTK